MASKVPWASSRCGSSHRSHQDLGTLHGHSVVNVCHGPDCLLGQNRARTHLPVGPLASRRTVPPWPAVHRCEDRCRTAVSVSRRLRGAGAIRNSHPPEPHTCGAGMLPGRKGFVATDSDRALIIRLAREESEDHDGINPQRATVRRRVRSSSTTMYTSDVGVILNRGASSVNGSSSTRHQSPSSLASRLAAYRPHTPSPHKLSSHERAGYVQKRALARAVRADATAGSSPATVNSSTVRVRATLAIITHGLPNGVDEAG